MFPPKAHQFGKQLFEPLLQISKLLYSKVIAPKRLRKFQIPDPSPERFIIHNCWKQLIVIKINTKTGELFTSFSYISPIYIYYDIYKVKTE